MKRTSLYAGAVTARAFGLLVGLAVLPAGAAVFDDFEAYAAGSNLHGQGGWSGWAADSGAGALVSTSFAFSPTRSVNVNGAADLVRTFSGATNGQWVFTVMQYVPSTSSGTNYVILLNRYRPPFNAADLNWSVQIQNNLNTGQVISDLGGGATQPMVKDQWVEIRAEVNLASNTVTEYYNGQLLSTHAWQDGTGANELQALDLFAGDSGPVYFDNVSLAPAPPGTVLKLGFTTPTSANEFTPQAVLEWNAEPGKTYRVQSTEDLAPGAEWKTEEPVTAAKVGPLRWMAPEALQERKYYRLELPQPEIHDVQPTFIDSSDTNATLYILGQMLPGSALVVINGQTFAATNDGSGALAVRLNGLPPGEPVFGTITVMDVGSNLVATLPVQSPIVYGPAMTDEQLQGPPEEPPASPTARVMKAKEKGNQTKCGNNLRSPGPLTVGSEECDDGAALDETTGWLSRKGYDYWQAQSALLASRKGYDYYQAQSAFAACATKKGYDYYQAQSQLMSAALTIFASKKGYDYYQAQSALNSAGLNNNPAFQQNNNQGQMPEYSRQTGREAARPAIAKACVSEATGELQVEATDLAIPGAMMDFAWTRTYRSRTGPTTAQGARWDFSYNVSLTQNGDGTVTLRPGNGRADTFYPAGTNGWLRDEYFCQVIDLNGDAFPDVIFADTGRWIFNPPGTPAGGKLAQIIDRNGNTVSLVYNPKGQLAAIVDSLGRTNTVTFNGQNQIAAVSDFTGRTVRYEYDGNGDLVAVVSPPVIGTPTGNDFPGGITNRHTYSSGYANDAENHLLLSVIDGKGQVKYQHVYQHNQTDLDFLRCVSVQEGTNPPTQYRYYPRLPTHLNSYSTVRCIANDPEGNVSESDFDSRGRCVALREFTGRAVPGVPVTDTLNRPTGKLRADDPDYFETRRSWSRDSLRTLETLPNGERTQLIYERDFNSGASARKKGDCRMVRLLAAPGSGGDLDGDGAPDIAELAWYFEHDPRFGSPPSRVQDHNSSRSNKSSTKSSGDDHNSSRSNKSGSVLDDDFGGAGYGDTVVARAPAGVTHEYHRFATSIIDPRGNVTTAGYDAKGNQTNREIPSLSLNFTKIEFKYNSRGQLTAITNAPDANGYRRVDRINYYSSGPQNGWPQSIVIDEPGLHLTSSYECDARGNVTRCVDPRGNDWLYTYNALDQLVRAQTPTNLTARSKSDFIYDANGNVTQTSDELRDESDNFLRNVLTLAEYDALDRCTSLAAQVSPGVFVTNKFSYDGNSQLTAVQSPLAVSGADPHAMLAYEYDERGLLFREIGAPGTTLGGTNEFSYDANGRLRRATVELYCEPMEVATRRSSLGPDYVTKKMMSSPKSLAVDHDGFGQPVSVTDSMSNVVSYVYDRKGNCTLVRCFGQTNDGPGNAGNVRLSEWRGTYDGLDRLVASSDLFFNPATQANIGDGASVTTFTYAPNSGVTRVTDDNGHVTRYAYDTAGRLASVTDPRTNVLSYACDAAGNVTAVTSTENSDLTPGTPQVFSIAYVYDSLGRCVSSADNVGNTNRYACDSLGRTVRVTDPNGVNTYSESDDLSQRLKLWVDKNGDGTMSAGELRHLAARNANSQLISVTDANTNTTTYAYDSLGRCVTVNNADGTHCDLIWSPRSNLLRVQDPNSNVISNRYDALDRLIARDITPGPGVATTTTFERYAYDSLDRLVAGTNNVSHSEFAYDSLDNCVRSAQDGLATTCTYDGVGNRISMTYPSGLLVTYTYDVLDQCRTVGTSGGGLPPTTHVTYDYDGPGRIGRISRANGVNTRVQWDGISGVPNANGDFGWRQVRGVNHQVAGGGAAIDSRVAKFDRNQNRTLRAQVAPFFQNGPMTTNTWAYDALNRMSKGTLFRANSVASKSYVLDGNGNRQWVTSNGVAEVYVMDPAPLPGPADFQMNQYTVTPFGAQTFDENGNLASRGSVYYGYDYADRLVEVAVPDAGGLGFVPVASYQYDALGRRISRTVYSSNPVIPPVTTVYVHGGGEVCDDGNIRDDDGALEMRVNGVLSQSFVLDGSRSHDDEILILPAGGPPQYPHRDDLGNVLALTGPGGNVIERYDYDDFGQPQFLTSDGFPMGTNSSPAGNPFLFHGMEWDGETGFHHDGGGNFFDPLTGRAIPGKVKDIRNSGMGRSKGGTVKWFNETKGFGFVANNPWSGGGGGTERRSLVSVIGRVETPLGLQ